MLRLLPSYTLHLTLTSQPKSTQLHNPQDCHPSTIHPTQIHSNHTPSIPTTRNCNDIVRNGGEKSTAVLTVIGILSAIAVIFVCFIGFGVFM